MQMEHLTRTGFSIHKAGAMTLAYKAPLAPDMIPLDGPIGRPTTLKGRRQIRYLEPGMIVRELVHGGAFARLTGERFLSPARSIREIMVSDHLITGGLPTPAILGLRIVRDGLFQRIVVISRLVPQATDLIAYLATEQGNAPLIMAKAGRLVRRMHDLKVYHADLHLKNFLLDKEGHLWLLDLDKAWRLPGVPQVLRDMNIRRFFRSCRKWQGKGRVLLPPEYRQRFLEGYRSTGS